MVLCLYTFQPQVCYFSYVMIKNQLFKWCHPKQVILIMNYAGKVGRNVTQMECVGGSQKLPRNKSVSLHEQNNTLPDSCVSDKGDSSSGFYDKYLWFGPGGNGGRCR